MVACLTTIVLVMCAVGRIRLLHAGVGQLEHSAQIAVPTLMLRTASAAIVALAVATMCAHRRWGFSPPGLSPQAPKFSLHLQPKDHTTMTSSGTATAPVQAYPLSTRVAIEGLGSFFIVFAGLGTALFNATGSAATVGFAYGLAMVAAIISFGHISNGYFNPAFSLGMAVAGRLKYSAMALYIVAQTVGAVLASAGAAGHDEGHARRRHARNAGALRRPGQRL